MPNLIGLVVADHQTFLNFNWIFFRRAEDHAAFRFSEDRIKFEFWICALRIKRTSLPRVYHSAKIFKMMLDIFV